MTSNKRFAAIAILVGGWLVAIVSRHAFEWIWMWAGWPDPSFGPIRTTMLLAVALGLAVIGFCWWNLRVRQLAVEVVDELERVSWPNRRETGNATIVVICTVLISSIFLGFFDIFWLWLTDLILRAGMVSG